MPAKDVVAIDFETFRFGPANMAPRPVCLSWAGMGMRGLLPCWESDAWDLLQDWLEAAAAGALVVVGQNVPYDLCCLMAERPDMVRLVFDACKADGVADTEIREKLWDNAHGQLRGWTNGATGQFVRHGYALDLIYKRRTGKDLPKPQAVRTSYGELWGVPIADWPEEHRRYAADDAPATLEVYEAQEALRPQVPFVFADEFRQVRKALALQLAAVWGIRTDAEAIERLRQAQLGKLDKARGVLVPAGIVRQNGSRNMKLAKERAQALVDARPGTAWPLTDGGALSLSEDACKDSGDPVLVALSEYGKAQNILAGSCKDFEAGTELPIHTRFDTLLASGRVSSSGPNLENLRKERGVRECFAPRAGFLYCSSDYSTAELHSLAQVCLDILGKSRLAQVLNDGIDPHLLVGARIMGIDYAEAVRRRKDPDVKAARQKAKPVNFGFPGGMGVRGFVSYAKNNYGVAFTEEEAARFRELWIETFPEMADYFAWVRSMVGDGAATIRQFYSDRLRGNCSYTEGANTLFQGHTGDGKGRAIFAVAEAEYAIPGSPLYGCRTVDDIHDELLVEVWDDPELAHAAAMEIKRIMEAEFNAICADVPVSAEPALMRRYSKAAEPAWRNGLLIPWEDAQ